MTAPQHPDDQTTIEDLPTTPAFAPSPVPVSNEVADTAPETAMATATAAAGTSRQAGRSGLRWLVALFGVILVIASSAVIVSLAASQPTPSVALGYMPASTLMYTEARLDLPGDQRQNLGEFLKTALPGFDDQSQLDAKLNEVFDRVIKAATNGKHDWTTEIAPWFGGQLAVGIGLPTTSAVSASATSAGPDAAAASFGDSLVVLTVKDKAKAEAWLATVGDAASTTRSTYNGADLFESVGSSGRHLAIAMTDTVMLAGETTTVKAAVDSGGNGSFASNADVKAALATIDKDNVGFSIILTKAYLEGTLKLAASAAPNVLGSTQIDDVVAAMIPAWQSESVRFESDALTVSTANPPWAIGYDTTNRASTLTGHVPAKTIAYAEVHDVGKVLSAILDKFRALPETKAALDAFDQAIAVVGGYDAVFGWWGDTAIDVTPLGDGTIGAGIVVKPTDVAAATRFFSTLKADLSLAGPSSGLIVREEDHNGTTITTVDFSGVSGVATAQLPPGYKAEIAWAVNGDVAVLGYGHDFVAAVLDAGPGTSLGTDARFTSLLNRVGAENTGLTFVDIAAIRGLIEPLVQAQAPADKWQAYVTNVKPYIEHLDALISATRKDGSLDRGSGALTVR